MNDIAARLNWRFSVDERSTRLVTADNTAKIMLIKVTFAKSAVSSRFVRRVGASLNRAELVVKPSKVSYSPHDDERAEELTK